MKQKFLGILVVLIAVAFIGFGNIEGVGSYTDKYAIVLDIHYDNGAITVNDMEIKRGITPDYITNPEDGYTLNLYSRFGKVIDSFRFTVPSEINIDHIDPETGEILGELVTRDEFDFTFRIPYIRTAEIIEIKNPENLVVFSGAIGREFSNYPDNQPETQEATGSCETLMYHGDPDQRLDVVFVPDNYTVRMDISDMHPADYQTDYLDEGDEYYIDRSYYITDIPYNYENLLWIMTANNNKTVTLDDWLNFTIDTDVIVYVGIDTRNGIPSWIESESWIETGDYITIEGFNGPLQHWLYYKEFPAGYVGIDGNEDLGNNMYIVLVAPQNPLEGFEEMVWQHIDPYDQYEGILSREPLQSNQHKFNFYYINEDNRYYCEQPITCDTSRVISLAEQCNYDEIIVLVDSDNYYPAWAYVGGHFAVSYLRSDIVPTPPISAHEFGHSWGILGDEYPNRYYGSRTDLVNCETADTEQACSDWCEGPPIPPEQDPSGCWQHETESTCMADYYSGCEWLNSPHPYFGYQCIKWNQNMLDIGTHCREGTGCFFNCHGTNGWRSVLYSIMYHTDQPDLEFGPVSQDWLESLLDEYPDYIIRKDREVPHSIIVGP